MRAATVGAPSRAPPPPLPPPPPPPPPAEASESAAAPPSVARTADRLSAALAAVEAALLPLLSSDSLSEQVARLDDPVDRCKLEVSLAYAITSVLWVFFKINGLDPRDHKLYSEIDRVRGYFKKINAAEGLEKRLKQSLTLDKDAAKRIFRSAQGSGTPDPDSQSVRFLQNLERSL